MNPEGGTRQSMLPDPLQPWQLRPVNIPPANPRCQNDYAQWWMKLVRKDIDSGCNEWRRRPNECHCTVRHFVWNLWRVFRAWPKNCTVCQGPFENCSPSAAVHASVASAINANICTGFTVILAIQHSHIFVVETSKMCRRNVRPVSEKRLSINRFVVETSVLHWFERYELEIGYPEWHMLIRSNDLFL